MCSRKLFLSNRMNDIKMYSLFLLCSILIMFLFMTDPWGGYYHYQEVFTLADCYVWFLKPYIYGFTVTPLLMLCLYHYDRQFDRPGIILRVQSTKRIYLWQLCKRMSYSLAISVVTTFAIGFIGGFFVKETINWECKNSIYYVLTGRTNSDCTLLRIILYYFALSFLRNVITSFVFQLIHWVLKKRILEWTIYVIVLIVELCSKRIKIFYKIITMDYSYLEKNEIGHILVYIVVFTLIFILISKTVVVQKEFIGDEL